MSGPKIGVLALQGDTREHLAALREAGATVSTVRRQSELDAVDAGELELRRKPVVTTYTLE